MGSALHQTRVLTRVNGTWNNTGIVMSTNANLSWEEGKESAEMTAGTRPWVRLAIKIRWRCCPRSEVSKHTLHQWRDLFIRSKLETFSHILSTDRVILITFINSILLAYVGYTLHFRLTSAVFRVCDLWIFEATLEIFGMQEQTTKRNDDICSTLDRRKNLIAKKFVLYCCIICCPLPSG